MQNKRNEKRRNIDDAQEFEMFRNFRVKLKSTFKADGFANRNFRAVFMLASDMCSKIEKEFASFVFLPL
jgi:hypothetical protein